MDQKIPDKVLTDEFLTEIGLNAVGKAHFQPRPNQMETDPRQAASKLPKAKKNNTISNEVFDCDISGFNNPLE